MGYSNYFLTDAMHLLKTYFNRIIRVNLTTDEYEPIWMYDGDDEISNINNFNKLSEWLDWMPNSGMVHSDDVIEFTRFADINHIKEQLKETPDKISFRYRLKKSNNDYSWTMMEIFPSSEYTNDNQIVMIYIRDINLDYSKDYEYRCKLERISMKDDLTGIQNRYACKRMVKYLKTHKSNGIGVLFADLNGLKFVNDNNGHVAGDNLIIKFANMLTTTFHDNECYRISGDEFIVIAKDCNFDKFKNKCKELDKRINNMFIPIASIGYMYSDKHDVNHMINDTEQLMYIRKNKFYEKFPTLKR